ncbi:MAG: hypothetical protein HQK60_06470 [Deltaproteobacteria bacterium]|nr:hypothetical protein [Deltaproteobacteria bacterium]
MSTLGRENRAEEDGTGIRRMREGAGEQGYPEPEFSADGFFTAVFQPLPTVSEQLILEVTQEVGTKQGPSSNP